MKKGSRCSYNVKLGPHWLHCEVELLYKLQSMSSDPEWVGKIVHIKNKQGFEWLSEGREESFEENLLKEIVNPNELLKDMI